MGVFYFGFAIITSSVFHFTSSIIMGVYGYSHFFLLPVAVGSLEEDPAFLHPAARKRYGYLWVYLFFISDLLHGYLWVSKKTFYNLSLRSAPFGGEAISAIGNRPATVTWVFIGVLNIFYLYFFDSHISNSDSIQYKENCWDVQKSCLDYLNYPLFVN